MIQAEHCYRNEGPTPFRPPLPNLVKYKSVVPGQLCREDLNSSRPPVMPAHSALRRKYRKYCGIVAPFWIGQRQRDVDGITSKISKVLDAFLDWANANVDVDGITSKISEALPGMRCQEFPSTRLLEWLEFHVAPDVCGDVLRGVPADGVDVVDRPFGRGHVWVDDYRQTPVTCLLALTIGCSHFKFLFFMFVNT
uniref:Uncharacterized protein n=1 Tax=Glossina pallidipes TaxID=7398 RepID=A0A1A9ZM72_GLOPL